MVVFVVFRYCTAHDDTEADEADLDLNDAATNRYCS